MRREIKPISTLCRTIFVFVTPSIGLQSVGISLYLIVNLHSYMQYHLCMCFIYFYFQINCTWIKIILKFITITKEKVPKKAELFHYVLFAIFSVICYIDVSSLSFSIHSYICVGRRVCVCMYFYIPYKYGPERISQFTLAYLMVQFWHKKTSFLLTEKKKQNHHRIEQQHTGEF